MLNNLSAAHRGYIHQDVLAACALVNCVTGAFESATIDRKLFDDDRFDDLTLSDSKGKCRVQVKSHSSEERILELRDLTTDHIGTRLDKLVDCFVRDPINVDYRLAATYGIPTDHRLLDLLRPAVDAPPVLIGVPTRKYRLSLEAMWPNGGRPTLQILRDLERDTLARFADSFVVDLMCPQISGDLRSPGPLERILFNLLAQSVGIGSWPNENKDVAESAAVLIGAATLARANGQELNRDDAIRALGLRTDFGRATGRFPVTPKSFVRRDRVHDDLTRLILSENRVVVVGPPGAGKSWVLSQIGDELRNAGHLVAQHYCHIRIGDEDRVRRSEYDTLCGSIVAELVDRDPSIREQQYPRFAAGPQQIEQLAVTASARQPRRRVVLIVDGLDHVSRVRPSATTARDPSEEIAAELALLKLPENATLIVGSQPGEHLAPLLDKGKKWRIPGWSKADVRSLVETLDVAQTLATSGMADKADAAIAGITRKSRGNALYATYLCREVRRAVTTETGFVALDDLLSSVPAFDQNLDRYYAWLLDSLEAVVGTLWLPEMLAVVDFSVTKDELREIRPDFGHWLEKSMSRLGPVLDDVAARGGIRIYHDSLQRYILRRLKQRNASVPALVEPVVRWLSNRGFFRDARSFRCLLPALERAGRFEEMLALCSSAFVSKSVAHGHSWSAVSVNLTRLARVAAKTRDWAKLGELNELSRSVWTCFDQKLTDDIARLYGLAFAELYGPARLSERLTYEGRTTLPPRVGLLLCELCDESKVPAPWKEYRRAHDTERERDNTHYGRDSDERVALARFRGWLRVTPPDEALPKAVQWLSEATHFGASMHGRMIRIARSVAGRGFTQALADRLPAGSTRAEAFLTIARDAQQAGLREEARALAQRAVDDGVSHRRFLECVHLGVPAGQFLPSREEFLQATRQAQDRDVQFNPEPVRKWDTLVRIAALSEPSLLIPVESEISGEGWYRDWLRFLVSLAHCESRGSDFIGAIQELARDTDPFKGQPRACDLYYLESLIHESIARALRGLRDQEWAPALEVLASISKGTLAYLQNNPGGPITPQTLVDLTLETAENDLQREAAKVLVATLLDERVAKAEFYEFHAKDALNAARLYKATGDENGAWDMWNRACRYLAGYGFRRDRTIYELLDSLRAFKNMPSEPVVERLASLHPMVVRVIHHTDGKDTERCESQWHDFVAERDPAGAARFFSHVLSRYGGRIDSDVERAIPTLLVAAENDADPLLLALIWLTITHSGSCFDNPVKCFERLSLQDLSSAKLLWNCMVASVEGDPRSPSAELVRALSTLSQRSPLPEITIDMTMSAEAPPREMGPAPRPARPWWELERPLIPTEANMLHVGRTIRGLYLRDDDSQVSDAWANAIGWRLLELLNAGEKVVAFRLIEQISHQVHFSGRAELLGALGEGLRRCGHFQAAAMMLTMAFTCSRGGGGWLVFGGPECHTFLQEAIACDRDTTIQTLCDEVARAVSAGGPFGVTAHLVRALYAIGLVEEALEVWDSGFGVLSARLPAVTSVDSPADTYTPSDQTVSTLDAELIRLLLTRLSHPGLGRKRSALLGLQVLIRERTAELAQLLESTLSRDVSVTTELAVMQAIWEFEERPFVLSQALRSTLRALTKTDVAGLRVLGRKLLRRIGEHAPQASPVSVGQAKETNDEKVREVLSCYRPHRFAGISGVWPD